MALLVYTHVLLYFVIFGICVAIFISLLRKLNTKVILPNSAIAFRSSWPDKIPTNNGIYKTTTKKLNEIMQHTDFNKQLEEIKIHERDEFDKGLRILKWPGIVFSGADLPIVLCNANHDKTNPKCNRVRVKEITLNEYNNMRLKGEILPEGAACDIPLSELLPGELSKLVGLMRNAGDASILNEYNVLTLCREDLNELIDDKTFISNEQMSIFAKALSDRLMPLFMEKLRGVISDWQNGKNLGFRKEDIKTLPENKYDKVIEPDNEGFIDWNDPEVVEQMRQEYGEDFENM